jgi:hypothetical protein
VSGLGREEAGGRSTWNRLAAAPDRAQTAAPQRAVRDAGGEDVLTRPGFVLGTAAALAAVIVVRPLVHGASLLAVAAFWATVLGEVVVPGVLLCRGARLCRGDDPWLTLGQGATLGLSVQGLALLAGRALGLAWLPAVVAVGVAGLGLVLDRRRSERGSAGEAPPPSSSVLTLVVILGAVAIQPLDSAAHVGEPAPFDLLFHAGNAAELRHRWPLEDPRVAGIPLRYHLLAYALPVEAADLGGVPVADPLLAVAPLFWLGLLALQIANAGRVLFRERRAGGLAAAVALFHVDPGQLLGLGPGAFNSFFATGVYGSPTTVCGLIVLAGLVIAVASWIDEGGVRHLVAAGFLAVAASAVKTTVLPVVVGGLGLCAAWALLVRSRRPVRRWVLAAVALAVAGAPLTLWQREGYSGMVHWVPATVFTSSPFAARVADALGPWAVRGVGALPAFLVWLVGYLGLAGLAAGAWLARRREALRPVQAWALGMVVVGGVLGLLLDVPGLSQLFLLYDGQLLLCLFAGAGLARALAAPRTPRAVAVAAVLALAALPAVVGLGRALPAAARADAAALAWRPSAALRDYAAGLDWLRANAAADAVVFADDPSLYLSAFGEVRLFYENGTYTTRAWQVGPGHDPWPERTALQTRLLRRPDPAAIAAAREAVGYGPRLLVVADYVPSRVESGIVVASPGPATSRRLFPERLFARRFANTAMQVYEVREPAAPAVPR